MSCRRTEQNKHEVPGPGRKTPAAIRTWLDELQEFSEGMEWPEITQPPLPEIGKDLAEWIEEG